jgi:homoserine dehydrogenase
VDIAAGRSAIAFGVPVSALKTARAVTMDQHRGAYYLRLMVSDEPGVIAGVAGALGKHQISIESMVQRGRNPGEVVPVVMVTHECNESDMTMALNEITKMSAVAQPPALIRIA